MRKHLVDGLATTAVALTLVAGLAVSPGWVAAADEGSGTPTRAAPTSAPPARRPTTRPPRSRSVQARLAAAQGRLQDTAVRVAQAEEAFNRARWHYREARRKQRAAERIQATSRDPAGHHARRVRRRRRRRRTRCRPRSPRWPRSCESDGIASVVDRTTSLQNAQAAMDQVYDDYDAAALLAGVASDQATEARLAADELREQTKRARATARETQRAAAGEADAVAAERVDLIGELARLQGISVALAEERQEWLEAQATPDADAHADPDSDSDVGADPTSRRTSRRTTDGDADGHAHQDADARPRRRRRPRPRRPHRHPRRPPRPTPTVDAHPDRDPDDSAARPQQVAQRPRSPSREAQIGEPVPVGRRRAGQVGLLGPDHARVAGGRHLAAALLSGPVRRVHADRRGRPAAR